MSLKVPFGARVAAADGVMVRDLDGEAVVLDLKTEKYFGLDEVAAAMWTALTGAETIRAAYEALLAAYDVEPEQLEADMAKLISNLAEHGLLVVKE